jgi:hypothetical protein
MALSSQQQQVLRAFNKAARDTKASPKIRKALVEAGLVESHLQNLNYGDRDSRGPLQQRPSQGWAHANDPYLAAVDFIKHAQPIAKKYGTAGELAQAVQRSAFPARYDQVSGQASALLGSRSAYSPVPHRVEHPLFPEQAIWTRQGSKSRSRFWVLGTWVGTATGTR